MALTGLAFLIAFVAGLGLCVARGPVWGLYTYVAVFYLHPPSRWWGAFLPDLRWSLLAAIVTLLCVLVQKQRRSERPPFFSQGLTWIFLLYVLWMWAQLPFVVSTDHFEGVVLFTKYFMLLYLIYEIVDSADRVRDFLVAHLMGCFYLSWLAYVAVGGGRLEGVGGPGIDDSNTMSMHLATGIVVGSVLLITERGWRFWLALASMPFLLNGEMQGSSRGAVLGLIAGGFCLFWLKPPGYRKQFIAFGVLGALLFGYLANDLFLERMRSVGAVASEEQQIDFSAASRLTIMRAEWQMFLDHPLGAGHAGTAALSAQYLPAEYLTRGDGPDAPLARASHNTFMAVVVDQGVPGIVLLIALLFWVWRSVGAVTKRSGRGANAWWYGSAVSAGLTVAVVAGQFSPYLKAEVQFWLLALLMSLKHLVDQTQPQEQATRPPQSGVVGRGAPVRQARSTLNGSGRTVAARAAPRSASSLKPVADASRSIER